MQIHLNTVLHLLLLLYKNEWKTGNKMLLTPMRSRASQTQCNQDRDASMGTERGRSEPPSGTHWTVGSIMKGKNKI